MQEAFPPEPGAAQQNDSQDVTAKLDKSCRASVSDAGEDSWFKKMFALMATKKTESPVNVHLPEVKIPDIKVPQPEITVNIPPFPEQKAPVVNFNPVIQSPPAPVVNIPPFPEQKAPIVNITAPPAPNVTVNLPRTKSVKFKRDAEGKITGAETVKD